ncbi:hypothetical protein AB0K18_23045 [Nonomuraea sp. NPDC049421]|uniref:hypothetical protein n=1 Tax=Nonomuraea sp. NPDC049421 TaxID=3155275 RepID=UPI003448E89C
MTIRDPAAGTAADAEVTAEPETPMAESPLVPGVTISVGEPERTQPWRPLAAAGAIRAFAGPDAGRVVWLTPGSHLIGRERTDIDLLRDFDRAFSPAPAARITMPRDEVPQRNRRWRCFRRCCRCPIRWRWPSLRHAAHAAAGHARAR